MSSSDFRYFEILKKEISRTLSITHPGIERDIQKWKGKEIDSFQKDLVQKVNGRVSEKWFYSHIKTNSKTIPRIDVLDMLSQYTGKKNWLDFKKHHITKHFISGIHFKIILLLLLAILVSSVAYVKYFAACTFHVCCLDAYTRKSVSSVDIWLLSENESPVKLKPTENGCWDVNTKKTKLVLAFSAPYYQPDTITRFLYEKDIYEDVILKPDDYALMIRLYSGSKVKDWNHRRDQLNEILHENAKIFQVDPEGKKGMEMYNKTEFINKLTIPARSLGAIEIIQIKYQDGKIAVMRFIQKNTSIQ
jgi:hypothetical protein